MHTGEIILYTTEDGGASIQLRAEGETVWLTQSEMAELFQMSKQNISLQIKNILLEGEQDESVVKYHLTTTTDGKNYRVKNYNLKMILAVGYRVTSQRGTQFRKWATTHLEEYLVKGFVMNDACLKEPSGSDYFDEWIERIREIRASEKRFYQKVRDLYATAIDYDPKGEQAQLFFKKVQNKMLWATTHRTAADSRLPNMGLTSWKGSRVKQQDATIAKNYLNQLEIEELNEIVVMYLDYAGNQAKRRKTITMAQWEEKLDAFLSFNEKDLLNHAGKISAEVAEKLALERYEQFDEKRKLEEKEKADAEDVILLKEFETKMESLDIKK